MPLLPGMLRPEQSGVAGCNVSASEINWTCHACDLCVTVARQYDDQKGYVDRMPEGWVHALVQQPCVNRISLLCRFCAEGITVAALADRQKAEHEAWIQAESAWIKEQMGATRADLLAQRRALDVKLSELSAESAEESTNGAAFHG